MFIILSLLLLMWLLERPRVDADRETEESLMMIITYDDEEEEEDDDGGDDDDIDDDNDDGENLGPPVAKTSAPVI